MADLRPTLGQNPFFDTWNTLWAVSHNTDGTQLPTDKLVSFSKSGVLTTGTGASRMIFPVAATIVSVTMACNTAPASQSIICDVNKNGTTIFTTQANRPAIAATANASSAALPDVTSVAAGNYLTVDIDQVGSGTAGSDLTVVVRYQ